MKAYTIGSIKTYDEVLATNTEVKKTGRTSDYGGGWVWKTKEDAEQFIATGNIVIDGTKRDKSKFAVYELELSGNWETDVLESITANFLLVDARIIRKV